MPKITKQKIKELGQKAGFQYDDYFDNEPGFILKDKDLLSVEEYPIGEEIIKFVKLLGFEVIE